MTAFSDRRVKFDRCFNFRDLGGYETTGGRRLRWRTLYRADTLHRIDGDDLAAFLDLGLRTVIDLRSQFELESHGRLSHGGEEITVHHLPVLDTVGGPDQPRAPETIPATVGEAYVAMADGGRRAIAEALTLLAQPDAMPAVFHCTAGKDRTGILAALVMSHLGVSDDDIVDDYMLTLESRPERNAYLQVHEPEYYEFLQNLPEPFRDMSPEAITTLLAWLRREHGTVTDYLLACGVTPETLSGLEANLLEP